MKYQYFCFRFIDQISGWPTQERGTGLRGPSQVCIHLGQNTDVFVVWPRTFCASSIFFWSFYGIFFHSLFYIWSFRQRLVKTLIHSTHFLGLNMRIYKTIQKLPPYGSSDQTLPLWGRVCPGDRVIRVNQTSNCIFSVKNWVYVKIKKSM